MIVTNVTLDATQANFPPASSGGNVNMTNSQGEIFVLRVDARVLDITGQPKPAIPVNVIGVLAQFDSSAPYTTGYQLTPTRFADIVGGAAAPKIEFTNVLQLVRLGDSPTNTFIEHVLQPGSAHDDGAGLQFRRRKVVDLSAPATGFRGGGVESERRLRHESHRDLHSTRPARLSLPTAHRSTQAANAQVTNTATWTTTCAHRYRTADHVE